MGGYPYIWCAPGGIRTHNLLIRRSAHLSHPHFSPFKPSKYPKRAFFSLKCRFFPTLTLLYFPIAGKLQAEPFA